MERNELQKAQSHPHHLDPGQPPSMAHRGAGGSPRVGGLQMSPQRSRQPIDSRIVLKDHPLDTPTRGRIRFWFKLYWWHLCVGGARFAKRVIDVLLTVLLLIPLAPLLGLTALLIKLTDGGPVLYWQTRVGLQGRRFPIPKFRSMVVNASSLQSVLVQDNATGIRFKMKRDPRVTTVGRVIRQYSIDELPQLWNVLKGEMTLVGPRPPIPEEVSQYTISQRRRLDVVPGLTCIWQVSGRSDIPFEKQVTLDVEYIESHSLWFDLKLLLKTIPAVVTGRGAY